MAGCLRYKYVAGMQAMCARTLLQLVPDAQMVAWYLRWQKPLDDLQLEDFVVDFLSGFMIPNRSTVKTVAIYCLVIKHGNAPSNASVECHCHLCFCTSQLFTVADSLTDL